MRLMIKNTIPSRVIPLIRGNIRDMARKKFQEIERGRVFTTREVNRSSNAAKGEEVVSYRDFIPSPNDRRRRPGYDPQVRMIELLAELSKIERGDAGQRTDSLRHLSYPELKREFMIMEKEYIYQRYCH